MSTTNNPTINLEETASLLAASINTHSISLNDAAALTANYRNFHNNDPATIRGGAFSKDIIQDILNQTGCEGIRYYYGMDTNNVPQLVLVGYDASDNDLFNGVRAEKARLCPPSWPDSNQLNPGGTLNVTPAVDHNITLIEAADFTANYRTFYNNDPTTIRGGAISKGIIQDILNQATCEGLRYYYGIDATNQPHIVLVGIDNTGNDQYNLLLAERARLCPPSWPVTPNPINP
jgi:hypothetical protein